VTTPVPLRSLDRGSTRVLVASADEAVRAALTRSIDAQSSDVLTAATPDQALARIAAGGIACVVIDLHPTGGFDLSLVRGVLACDPLLSLLVLASAPLMDDASLSEQANVEWVTKPAEVRAIGEGVRRALRRRDALRESEQINAWLAEEVAGRTAELARERERLEHLSVAAFEALVNALEAKDPHLRGHSARVAEFAGHLGEEYGLSPEAVQAVRTAGRLHDIDKIGIREQVLNKQGPLTDEEFEHIKAHSEIGAKILAPFDHLGDVIGFVHHHHERWDGNGYPDGLAGERIPVGARLIGAAEIYDALTTSRPYQPTMTPAEAVRRMQDLVGTVLDPTVHAAIARLVAREASGGGS